MDLHIGDVLVPNHGKLSASIFCVRDLLQRLKKSLQPYCSDIWGFKRNAMPIKSYLVHPEEGKKVQVAHELSNIVQCEVIPAKNKEVLILVTETASNKEEDILKEKLDGVKAIRLMALVSGFDTPKNE